MGNDTLIYVDLEFLIALVGDELCLLPCYDEGVEIEVPGICFTHDLFRPGGSPGFDIIGPKGVTRG